MSKKNDLPGQLDLTGDYAKKPDKACEKNAKPLPPTALKAGPKPKAKIRQFNLKMAKFSDGMKLVTTDPDEFREADL